MFAAMKAVTTFVNFHFSIRHTLMRVRTKATKRTPWIVPMILTAMGIFAMYLSGMATKKRRMAEHPSARLVVRNILSAGDWVLHISYGEFIFC